MSENRESDRKKLIVDVHFEGGDATGIADTRDIGMGGLFMRTKAVLKEGEHIRLKLNLGGETISLNGAVVHVDSGIGVGVKFNPLSEGANRALTDELSYE